MFQLSKADLQEPRNSKEILPWVKKRLTQISSTPEGIELLRLRKDRFIKMLLEECHPLAIFADKFFNHSTEVIVECVLGNQNYDAKICDKRSHGSSIKFVEITQAHYGADEYYRMLHLQEKGHVSMFGRVNKKGTKNTGYEIEVKNVAKNYDRVLFEEIELIHKAAVRKSKKKYPARTALLIACEDYIVFRNNADIEQLLKYFADNTIQELDRFHAVFLVGLGSRLFLQLQTKPSSD